MSARQPVVGEIWQRRNGRERVEVRRIWTSPEGPTVRAHPRTGGRYLIAALDWFVENYNPPGDDR